MVSMRTLSQETQPMPAVAPVPSLVLSARTDSAAGTRASRLFHHHSELYFAQCPTGDAAGSLLGFSRAKKLLQDTLWAWQGGTHTLNEMLKLAHIFNTRPKQAQLKVTDLNESREMKTKVSMELTWSYQTHWEGRRVIESTVREQLRTNLFSLGGTNPSEDLAGGKTKTKIAEKGD